MWIVRLALRRPYTFVVVAILIVIMGALAIVRTPTDIFPNIDIPVVSIIWNYNGLVPEDMADRIVSVTERALTTTVDNIEHIESQSLYGIAVVKVFLQPTANIQQGIAQITAVSQTQLRQLPAGTTPPLILAYSASSVPVLQLALSGQNMSEQELNDYGLNFIRTQIITVPGASVPYPYGGKQRQVQVDLNTTALQSKGLSALDVVNAISLQNLILPTGTSKIGSREYDVSIPNAAPQTIADLNRIPIKTIGSTTIYIKDVAWVRDGFPPQTNIVKVNGQRSVLLTIQKAGNASTLNVIAGIKALLPQIKTTVPPQLQIEPVGGSVDFCSWRDQRSGQGNADRRMPDGFHDSHFPGQLAKHHYHRDLNPSGDPDLHHCVQCDRRNDQHHDARWTRSGGRHPGGRCHGRSREHQSKSRGGAREGHGRSCPRQRVANRDTGFRVHALDLHCVCSDVLAVRCGAVPLCAARRSGRFRDVGIVSAFADDRSDDGQVPIAGQIRPRTRMPPAAIRWCASKAF